MTAKFTAVCVEDDQDARLLFRHAVNRLGGHLVETENATDGWAAVQAHRPDIVLMDLALPGQSGWKVVEKMHQDQALQNIPVIVVTIRDQAEEQYHGRHVDWVVDYITKPFEIANLETSISKVLGL